MAIVTHDSVAILKRFSKDKNIAYTLLSDPKAEIISAFGLINEDFPPGSPWYGIAHPMTLVVDAGGVVRHRFSERRYRDRPDVDAVLNILRNGAGG